MKVKELINVANTDFIVIVKQPGKCVSYKCKSNNKKQYEDFANREIYEFDIVFNFAYCW